MRKSHFSLAIAGVAAPRPCTSACEARTCCEETLLSPALRHAVDREAHVRSSRGFDEAFWARLEERRERNSTWKGRFQQLLETEVSGIAVWRVLGSGALGAALPALVLTCCALSSPSHSVTPSPLPTLRTITPWNQRRFWEEVAWKNPTKPMLVSLLDPNWKGGSQCEFRFVV